MAIEKRFIHFKTFSKFKEKLESGNILDTSIVFIKDTRQIYTHGEFYDYDGILGEDYGPSKDNSQPQSGDSFETAISKLHAMITRGPDVAWTTITDSGGVIVGGIIDNTNWTTIT